MRRAGVLELGVSASSGSGGSSSEMSGRESRG